MNRIEKIIENFDLTMFSELFENLKTRKDVQALFKEFNSIKEYSKLDIVLNGLLAILKRRAMDIALEKAGEDLEKNEVSKNIKLVMKDLGWE